MLSCCREGPVGFALFLASQGRSGGRHAIPSYRDVWDVSPLGEVGCKSLLYVCCSVMSSMDHANSSFADMHLFHVPA